MSVELNQTYYELLGVSKKATSDEIRVAYKMKARKSHPDKAVQNNLTIEQATEIFKLIQEAYETLSDPEKRYIYDKESGYTFTHEKAHFPPRPSYDFFNEMFGPGRAHGFRHNEQYEDEEIIPSRMDKETDQIIDSDDCHLLYQFLRTKSVERSFLNSILYSACAKGKLNIVRDLIEVRKLNAKLKVHDDSFTAPIFGTACESGNLDLVKYLLEIQHVDIESPDSKPLGNGTALSRAAQKGHEDVVRYLISKGANLYPKLPCSSILGYAIDSQKLSIVVLFVEAGIVIDDYALNKALEYGSLEIVQYILEKRPGIENHKFPLSSITCRAILSGNVSLVKYLEVQENLDIFKQSEKRGFEDTIDSLIRSAAKSSSTEMLNFLLDERGLNEKVSTTPKYIKSILRNAFRYLSTCSSKIEKQRAMKIVQFLMEERQFILSKEKLEKFIFVHVFSSWIEMCSYFQSYLYEPGHIKDILLIVANHGLEALSFSDLLTLFHLKILKSRLEDYNFQIRSRIEECKISIEQMRDLFLGNKQIMTEALTYYSSSYCRRDSAPLKLLRELGADFSALKE